MNQIQELISTGPIENYIDSCLCIWEWALEDDGKFLELLKNGQGVGFARSQVMIIAHHFDVVYELTKERGFCDSYDFEFVPLMAQNMVDGGGEIDNHYELNFCNFVADTIWETYSENHKPAGKHENR